jgi:hypothetical protein
MNFQNLAIINAYMAVMVISDVGDTETIVGN